MGHPSYFQRLPRLGRVTARQSSSERQPNFAALNRGRHLCSAGRPSRWALAHICSLFLKSDFNFFDDASWHPADAYNARRYADRPIRQCIINLNRPQCTNLADRQTDRTTARNIARTVIMGRPLYFMVPMVALCNRETIYIFMLFLLLYGRPM